MIKDKEEMLIYKQRNDDLCVSIDHNQAEDPRFRGQGVFMIWLSYGNKGE